MLVCDEHGTRLEDGVCPVCVERGSEATSPPPDASPSRAVGSDGGSRRGAGPRLDDVVPGDAASRDGASRDAASRDAARGDDAGGGGGRGRGRRTGDGAPGPRLRVGDLAQVETGRWDDARRAIRRLDERAARHGGRVLGIAGPSEHGKTQFSERLMRKRFEELRSAPKVEKTKGGWANIWPIPGADALHQIVDVAGEDFTKLRERAPGTRRDRGVTDPLLESTRWFLWETLRRVDGLILLISLPQLWRRLNPPPGSDPPGLRAEMQVHRTAARIEDAAIGLLKTAAVAADFGRLRASEPGLRDGFLDGEGNPRGPTPSEVGALVSRVRRLRIPVFVGLSFADCFRDRTLRGPGEVQVGPAAAEDPWSVGSRVFPGLYDLLRRRVRHYKWDFVQSIELGRPEEPEGEARDQSFESLIGVEGALEFLASHPWWLPGPGTRTWRRLARRDRGPAVGAPDDGGEW